jgi:2-methylcitrate dehydratase
MIVDLAGELSECAVSLRYSDLSKHAVHTAKQRLVDSLGCGLGAVAAVPARNGRAFAREYPCAASTILGTTQATTPDVAAFVNGTMVRYFDYNDGYIGKEVGHPSDNIPAWMAVAESEGASGRISSSLSSSPTKFSAGSRTRPTCTAEAGTTSTTSSCHRRSQPAG